MIRLQSQDREEGSTVFFNASRHNYHISNNTRTWSICHILTLLDLIHEHNLHIMHVSYISHLVTKIWFPPEAKTPPIPPPPAYIFVIKAHNNEQRRKLSLKYNQSKVQETYAWQLENILWSKNDFCSKFFSTILIDISSNNIF